MNNVLLNYRLIEIRTGLWNDNSQSQNNSKKNNRINHESSVADFKKLSLSLSLMFANFNNINKPTV